MGREVLFRDRPLVFVSSTINELQEERRAIAGGLEKLGLVDGWLFEHHFSVSGAAPDAQYLARAQASDLFVLIIFDEASDATRAEYDAAYADTPLKIMAYTVGAGDERTRELRAEIMRRHTRRALADRGEIADSVVRDVNDMILSAGIIVPRLKSLYLDRLATLDRLVPLTTPLSLVPSVGLGDEDAEGLPQAWRAHPHLVLEGIGGSGKTTAALSSLVGLCAQPDALPLFVRASQHVTLRDGVGRAFDAAKFHPGTDLLASYARDGRLAIVLDGLDDLSGSEHLRLLRDVDDYCEQFPRTHLLVLCRMAPSMLPSSFALGHMRPLASEQIEDLFLAQGISVSVDRDVPESFRDLIFWPLWAKLLAGAGRDVDSALELLTSLVDERLTGLDVTEALEVRESIGYLALQIRPAVDLQLRTALRLLQDWLNRPAVSSRFVARPSEHLLDRTKACGLIVESDENVEFVHPLIALLLASEAAATMTAEGQSPTVDTELLPFVSALVPEERHREAAAALAQSDVFVLARYVRLATRATRVRDEERDKLELRELLHALLPLIGEGNSTDADIEEADSWTMLRSADREPESSRFTLWIPSPLVTRPPLWLAAVEVMLRFKAKLIALRPSGREFAWVEEQEIRHLLRDEAELIRRCTEFASQYFDAHSSLVRHLSLPSTWFLGTKQPTIVVTARQADGRISIDWSTPGRVEVLKRPLDLAGNGIQVLWADPPAVAYSDLAHQVERTLGASLASQYWRKPELLATWTW